MLDERPSLTDVKSTDRGRARARFADFFFSVALARDTIVIFAQEIFLRAYLHSRVQVNVRPIDAARDRRI